MTIYSEACTLLSGCKVPVYLGRIQPPPEGPFLLVTPQEQDPDPTIGRVLSRRERFHVMAVNNNPSGWMKLHQLAETILDGGRTTSGYRFTQELSGPLIEDRDDPTRFRWSRTAVFAVTTPTPTTTSTKPPTD